MVAVADTRVGGSSPVLVVNSERGSDADVWGTVVSSPCYFLNTSVDPSGSGAVGTTPANCSETNRYTSGTTVPLAAQASTGYIFSHWSGDASGTISTISVKMDSDKTVVAHFTGSGDGDGEKRKVYLPLVLR
jgi:hypothetical protein